MTQGHCITVAQPMPMKSAWNRFTLGHGTPAACPHDYPRNIKNDYVSGVWLYEFGQDSCLVSMGKGGTNTNGYPNNLHNIWTVCFHVHRQCHVMISKWVWSIIQKYTSNSCNMKTPGMSLNRVSPRWLALLIKTAIDRIPSDTNNRRGHQPKSTSHVWSGKA